MSQWIEGVHYYMNEDDLVVLTEKFHLQRGYCCGNGCRHCPFNYKNVPEPKRSELLKSKDSSNLRES
ncbi:DUF5522 domain-containing protein [Terrimonas pollutisoli]|uniref:DUF5522 domain-containing protein n=1 Tax=Terrimonas pollutisoli TaxID=3034147 RepID=UPI0023ED5B5B|nr:DUF5522 domain-containing protein [Terrimonas sp. H1YJ31]